MVAKTLFILFLLYMCGQHNYQKDYYPVLRAEIWSILEWIGCCGFAVSALYKEQ